NATLGRLLLVGVATAVTVTTGGTVSTVHVRLSLPWLPAASVASTVKVCMPSALPVSVTGDVQAVNAPPSRLHATTTGAPAVVKLNVAVGDGLAAGGPAVIVAVGGTVSTVQVKDAVAALPTGSVARTVNV